MPMERVSFQCAINPSHSKFYSQALPKFGVVLEACLSGTPTICSTGNQTEKSSTAESFSQEKVRVRRFNLSRANVDNLAR